MSEIYYKASVENEIYFDSEIFISPCPQEIFRSSWKWLLWKKDYALIWKMFALNSSSCCPPWGIWSILVITPTGSSKKIIKMDFLYFVSILIRIQQCMKKVIVCWWKDKELEEGICSKRSRPVPAPLSVKGQFIDANSLRSASSGTQRAATPFQRYFRGTFTICCSLGIQNGQEDHN